MINASSKYGISFVALSLIVIASKPRVNTRVVGNLRPISENYA